MTVIGNAREIADSEMRTILSFLFPIVEALPTPRAVQHYTGIDSALVSKSHEILTYRSGMDVSGAKDLNKFFTKEEVDNVIDFFIQVVGSYGTLSNITTPPEKQPLIDLATELS